MSASLMPVLACGPGGGMMILVVVAYGCVGLCLASFILGLVCLMMGLKGLGFGLTSFSIALGAALLLAPNLTIGSVLKLMNL